MVRMGLEYSKVKLLHKTGEYEFYQLLNYIWDVDLNEKLHEWEAF